MAWSPDGMGITFFGTGPLLKMYDLTTDETTIVLDRSTLYDLLDLAPETKQVSAGTHSLAWSPTGEWIGLGINQFGETETVGRLEAVKGWVVLVRPDGNDAHILLTEAGVSVIGWSPDGRWLTSYMYARERFTATVVGIDGTVLFETNVLEAKAFGANVLAASGMVAWSPGGRYLAVAEPEGRLHILEVGSGTRYSFKLPARCGSVVWNPRGPLHEPMSSVKDMMPQPDWRSTVDQCDLPSCQH
jgi:hypothetical protein